MKTDQPLPRQNAAAFLRDERFLRILGQVVFLILLGILLAYLANNMLENTRRQGITLSFAFLKSTAGFDIGEHLITYARTDTFARAFLVGLLNTLLVSGLGIVFATLLGVIFGVARLSTNFLVQQIARAYIEFLRNIPLLVLLIFLYLGVFIKLPRIREAYQLPGPILLSNRGVAIPWGIPTAAFSTYLIILGVGLMLAVGISIGLVIYGRRTGRAPLPVLWGLLTFTTAAVLGWMLLPTAPLEIDPPVLQGLRMVGGKQLSPEFMALLSGLAIYTSAFIADVVRTGIQSISRGQIEAARSLGLSGMLSLRLIIFPQALRVIIPPLTSQYLNLTKNSSLAVAIGYPELFHVSGTILNQSGRTVEMVTLAMLTYLSISLATSAFMNWYNQRVRIVER
jgi:general L-amino acid transport system permease protein